MKNVNKLLTIGALLIASFVHSQTVITRWNFNSNPPDANTGTGDSLPSLGSGSIAHAGAITKTYAAGTGSADTVTTDNSAYNTTGYPAANVGSETSGLRFNISTVGFNNIVFNWSQRHSNTSSRFIRLQYTTNGTTWINYTGVGTDTVGLYRATAGDTWFNRSANFTGIAGVSNNPNFGVRVVTAFALGDTAYRASGATSNYATTGTLRFDWVVFSGSSLNAVDFSLHILHSSDMESSLDAVVDMPNFAAVVDTLEGMHPNTVILSSGDNILPGPFLSAGEDPSLQTPLRTTASSYWAGNTGQLRAAIGRPDIAVMNIIGYQASTLGNHEFDLGTTELNSIAGVDIRSNGADRRWIGAQFPYLSANLNFSNDANLSYLFTNQVLPVDSFKTPVNITTNNQKRGLAPSTIINVGGQRIGIVGATTQILARISSPGNTTIIGPQVDDMPALANILQPVIDTLRFREGINKIIVMSHLQQLALEEALAPLLRGVDIIIAGGSHTLLADSNDRLRAGNTATRTYPIMTTNFDSEPLAIINTTSEWKYVGRFLAPFNASGTLVPSAFNSAINGAWAADSAMVTQLWGTYSAAFVTGTKGANVRILTNAINNVIVSKDGNKFGKTNVFLEGRRERVRTEETNLGNVTADANLWMARRYDNTTRISIKNGGGIRSAIGEVFAVGNQVELRPTAPNPSANKLRGDISQLDIENSLRFNNRLSLLSLSAANLRRILEHGVAATTASATPGQFPQVSGVRFSYDITRPSGSRILSAVITDTVGNTVDTLIRNGQVQGDTNRVFRIVTLDFLAGGGDSYPFNTLGFNRVNLDTAIKDSMTARFTLNGSEQDAFAEYMSALFSTNPYNERDTAINYDRRIQRLNVRPDGIFPEASIPLTIANAKLQAAPTIVKVRGVVTRAWGRFIYIQDATGGLTVRQGAGAMVDSITAGALRSGDSVEVSAPVNIFNNLFQVQLATGAYTATNYVTRIQRDRPLPAPALVTLRQLIQNGEQFESRIVRVVNLRTNGTGNFTSSTNYTIWDAPGDTLLMRVIASQDSEMDDAPLTLVPAGAFTFEGTLTQFCAAPASGCTNGYQLQIVRKADIILPLPQAFQLAGPANNTRLVTRANNSSNVNITWSRSANATRYRWLLASAAGNFATPLASFNSNNNGMDTVLTLRVGQIDTLLSTLNVATGDSVNTKWTVVAYNPINDSILASTPFDLRLVRYPELGAFTLATPATNTRLETRASNTNPINITWIRSRNAIRYRWILTTAGGSFNPGLFSTLSNNNGVDTVLTLTVAQIDALLASLNIRVGDSVNTQWTVRSYNANNDSIVATTPFDLRLVRYPTLSSFNLATPPTGTRLLTSPSNSSNVNIRWTRAAGANRYRWFLDSPTGSFNPGLFNTLSNNNGTDTTLTLTVAQIDALLNTLGVASGDSINTKWTVKAYNGRGDSILATTPFDLKLVRTAPPSLPLSAFTLTSPPDQTRLVTVSGDPTPVIINWTASTNAVRYDWIIDLETGPLTAGLIRIPTTSNSLTTLTNGAIDAQLALLGVAEGDSINTRWTVTAFNSVGDSLRATAPFRLKLVRDKPIGINELSMENTCIYPNPTKGNLMIRTSVAQIFEVEVLDITGKLVAKTKATNFETNMDMSNMADGMYFIRVKADDAVLVRKINKH
jgi:2',3'-cyclic-nucleotide 2'-phosphodiesterase (5'-nucleotidase family)